MLLFAAVNPGQLKSISRKGLVAQKHGPILLWTTFEAARRRFAPAAYLIIDATGFAIPPGATHIEVPHVPLAAIRNLNPYRSPKHIVAAGGYVMRRGKKGPKLLMIHRRGVWDLPKGKLDPGETIEACALREVREEVGIEQLELIQPLGTTFHDFTMRGRYRIKTTYWYLMTTPERDFTPQAEEDIEKVKWKKWEKAKRKIGYESLRDHMIRVEADIEAWYDAS